MKASLLALVWALGWPNVAEACDAVKLAELQRAVQLRIAELATPGGGTSGTKAEINALAASFFRIQQQMNCGEE